MNEAIRNTPLTDKIRKEILAQVSSKKLTDKKIKDFMKKYYDGDPTMECPKGCKGTCLLDCYIEIHQALVDDNGNQVPFRKWYIRDGVKHCCGKEMSDLGNKRFYCTVCGCEHK